MKKFKLSHVVLYAKGWYLNTGDVFEDLRKILKFDGYAPYSDTDIYSILIDNVQDLDVHWMSLLSILENINPSNCWKFGYSQFSSNPKEDLPDYNHRTAFVYYVLSNLRFIDSEQWNVVTPKGSKYPIGKGITVRKIYKLFVKKNK